MSRKYAYQVLLAEELGRCGVELIFLRAPSGATAEDQLLVQFQGMIAEYERAQIAERSRRGKRHRAHQGSLSVMSGAPFGYRYVKQSDTSAAYYEVVESEAEVVRLVFDAYMRQGLSMGAIARLLNQREVPTRTQHSQWNRSTIWKMLHNPAYQGRAYYAKPSFVLGGGSRGACASAGYPVATARFGNGRVTTGSKSPFPLWSVKRPSLWRKSN